MGLEPIDLRWSFDRLAGIVVERLGREPRSRALFVFFGKRHAAIKVLFFDGTGLCLFYKRLDRGDVPRARAARRRDDGAVERGRAATSLSAGLDAVVAPRKVKARIALTGCGCAADG